MKLAIDHLWFHYNGVPVLRDVTMDIVPGEFVGIVGPNGSGKSTLLRCIDGILTPVKGSVSYDGIPKKDISRNRLARMVAYVPQGEGRLFPARVTDTVLMGRKPYISWKPGKHDLQITAEIIKKLDMEDIASRYINELSGGQRQRVFIGRALAQDTRLLLLDEPTANLDIRHQLEVLDLLKKLSGEGKTVMIAIHDLNMAVRYCSRLVMLNKGKVFASGGREILRSATLKKLYGVELDVIRNRKDLYIVPAKDR